MLGKTYGVVVGIRWYEIEGHNLWEKENAQMNFPFIPMKNSICKKNLPGAML